MKCTMFVTITVKDCSIHTKFIEEVETGKMEISLTYTHVGKENKQTSKNINLISSLELSDSTQGI